MTQILRKHQREHDPGNGEVVMANGVPTLMSLCRIETLAIDSCVLLRFQLLLTIHLHAVFVSDGNSRRKLKWHTMTARMWVHRLVGL